MALKIDTKIEGKLTCASKNWHEGFGKFSPEHLKVSKIGLWWHFNWYSLYARLNSHYEAWSYKKKKHKKIKLYRKSVSKEPTVTRCLLILDLKPLRSWVKGKHSIGRASCVRKETVDIDILITSRNGDKKIMQSIRITSRSPSINRKWSKLSQF